MAAVPTVPISDPVNPPLVVPTTAQPFEFNAPRVDSNSTPAQWQSNLMPYLDSGQYRQSEVRGIGVPDRSGGGYGFVTDHTQPTNLPASWGYPADPGNVPKYEYGFLLIEGSVNSNKPVDSISHRLSWVLADGRTVKEYIFYFFGSVRFTTHVRQNPLPAPTVGLWDTWINFQNGGFGQGKITRDPGAGELWWNIVAGRLNTNAYYWIRVDRILN